MSCERYLEVSLGAGAKRNRFFFNFLSCNTHADRVWL